MRKIAIVYIISIIVIIFLGCGRVNYTYITYTSGIEDKIIIKDIKISDAFMETYTQKRTKSGVHHFFGSPYTYIFNMETKSNKYKNLIINKILIRYNKNIKSIFNNVNNPLKINFKKEKFNKNEYYKISKEFKNIEINNEEVDSFVLFFDLTFENKNNERINTEFRIDYKKNIKQFDRSWFADFLSGIT